ncbi:MAG: hypothetical protein IPJ13_10380 [Saprospiraceae bacterium]|nr:hypothetical protein [Saprospiraceae bacterium]
MKQVITELYLVENGHSSELIKQNQEAIDKIIDFFKNTNAMIDSKVKKIRTFCESNTNAEIIKSIDESMLL